MAEQYRGLFTLRKITSSMEWIDSKDIFLQQDTCFSIFDILLIVGDFSQSSLTLTPTLIAVDPFILLHLTSYHIKRVLPHTLSNVIWNLGFNFVK